MNALDQVTQYTKGNGISTTKTYDNLHYPETVTSPGVESSEYSFEAASGNLQYRTHGANTEIFSYDELNRLTDITFSGQTSNIDYTADNSGNIHTKYDAGTYSYDPDKVHAVSDIEGDNDIPSFDQNITYTAFNKVEQISEGNYELNFTYGLDRARKKTVLKENGTPVLQKYFFGSYEIREDLQDGTVYEYHFLPGGAIYRTENGMGEMLYTYSDYLGSITHVTDETGNLIHEQSFGAWGRERDPDTYEYTNVQTHGRASLLNDRGYTGHEMLPQFGLINMNGRLYDPILGRMLSPDPFVQMPDYSQNFNRYSYVLNNPLKYNDPSGEFWNFVVGAAIGGIMNWVTHGAEFTWEGLGYFAVGAGIGALSAGVGSWVATSTQALGAIPGAVVGAGAGAFTGGATSVLQGGLNNVVAGNDFWATWEQDLYSGASIGAVTGGIGGGMRGYSHAKAVGANRWTGKLIEAEISYDKMYYNKGVLQTDNSKHCYAHISEKIDQNHLGRESKYFLERTGYADGADPYQLWLNDPHNGVFYDVDAISYPGAQDMNNVGLPLQQNPNYHLLATQGTAQNGHAVEVVGIDLIQKRKLFFGGTKLIVKGYSVFDPISNTYIHGSNKEIVQLVQINYKPPSIFIDIRNYFDGL